MESHPMLADEVKTKAIAEVRQSEERITRCLSFLEEGEVWRDFNPHLVSVGNLILHLMGNLSQHVLSGLGRSAYTRQRSHEFTDKPGLTKAELLARFGQVLEGVRRVIAALQPDDLTRRYVIQGRECSGAEDLLSVLGHLSYHVGQITFAVKFLKNVDVGYYAGVDLGRQNAPSP